MVLQRWRGGSRMVGGRIDPCPVPSSRGKRRREGGVLRRGCNVRSVKRTGDWRGRGMELVACFLLHRAKRTGANAQGGLLRLGGVGWRLLVTLCPQGSGGSADPAGGPASARRGEVSNRSALLAPLCVFTSHLLQLRRFPTASPDLASSLSQLPLPGSPHRGPFSSTLSSRSHSLLTVCSPCTQLSN